MKKLISVLLVGMFLFLASGELFSQVSTIPAGTGPYANLGAAFTAINTQAVYNGVPVIVNINANLIEPVPAVLTGGTFTTCLIRPNGVRTVSGNLLDAIVLLRGAKNVTIDGLNAGGNSLTFNNVSGDLNAGSIRMFDGASLNIVRNCTCIGVGVSTTAGGRTINIGQTATTSGNNDNLIENNVINGGRRGIQTFGTAGSLTNDRTIIRNNVVKNTSSLAIFIGSETRDNRVEDNAIFNDVPVSVGAGINFRGINCQGVGTNSILRNRIFDLTSVEPSSTFYGILTIPVLLTAAGSNVSEVNVINNCVTMMTNNEAPFFIGADIAFIDNSYLANVYHNTFRVAGISPAAVVGQYTAALLVDNLLAGSKLNIYNNIAINNRAGGDPTSLHIGYDLTIYSDSLLIADSILLKSDYNMAKGTNPVAWDGGYDGFIFRNMDGLDKYKDFTCALANEQHTMFKDVIFAGPNTCVLLLPAVGGDMNGLPGLVPPVNSDIFGTPRNAAFPYKGAFEGNALKVLTLGACLEGKSRGQIRITLRTAACVSLSDCTSDINSTNTGRFAFGDAVPNGVFFGIQVNQYNHIQTYSALPNIAFAAGIAAYNFTTGPGQAFGGNMTPGPPSCFFGGDVNQDSTIDLTDIVRIFNDASAFTAGCRIRTDVNSDEFVDLTDLVIAFNNSSAFVSVISPCPEPSPGTNVKTSNSDDRIAQNFIRKKPAKLTIY